MIVKIKISDILMLYNIIKVNRFSMLNCILNNSYNKFPNLILRSFKEYSSFDSNCSFILFFGQLPKQKFSTKESHTHTNSHTVLGEGVSIGVCLCVFVLLNP